MHMEPTALVAQLESENERLTTENERLQSELRELHERDERRRELQAQARLRIGWPTTA
jgi:hypothetical protein